MKWTLEFGVVSAVCIALFLGSCATGSSTQSDREQALDRYRANCETVRKYEESWCEEHLDYDAFYNDSAFIVSVSFGPLDTLTVSDNQRTHQRMWEGYDFEIHGPIRFVPGVHPEELRIDGSVRMYIQLKVTSELTGRSVVLPVYEEYDFDEEGKITRLIYYGDLKAGFQSIDSVETDSSVRLEDGERAPASSATT